MSKPNYLVEHLLDPNYRDNPTSIVFNTNPKRLRRAYRGEAGDWNTIVRAIAGPPQWPVTWFPDANVAFIDQTERVWDSLRIAGLGQARAVISGVVEYEMTEWLHDPYHHPDRARNIKAALDGKTWLHRYNPGPSSPHYSAIFNYTHLVGLRRLLARPLPDGTTLVGTDATQKSVTMNAIRNMIGPRALGLAKKGRLAAEKKGEINLADEMHCLMVILFALTNRKPAVVLTADEDYMEIFQKVQWFFDTHFRAWLAAKMVRDGWYGEPASELKETNGYFAGPLALYRRPTSHLQEVLPVDDSSIRAGVVYVAPDGMVHKYTFPFEYRMLDMLLTRAVTDGRCTDLFGDANIHVDLGPLKLGMNGIYLGIGKDQGKMMGTNGMKTFLARMDQEHSMCCFERHSS